MPKVDLQPQREQAARLAAEHLSAGDPRMGALIARVGPHRPIITRDPFAALAGAITQQQVSMSAARSMQRKLKAMCPRGRLTPAAISALDLRKLRSAGLSRQKALYMRGLAEAFAARTLTPRKLRGMTDEAVIEATTAVKGIGRWTAEMLLIFCLERPDVWPVDDLGLRKAMQRYHGLPEMPKAREIADAGDLWRPYRSYATWYLWRSLEGPLMPGIAV
ncbi:DNA-3-methyladenine glycosylase [Phycisphaerae bacterium RAS1]|nr:DNA-3-methyladenine glycosylase [Phycisphaerae bacterium RAS1]